MNSGTTFNHIFGPVPSRRLGQSLGIDLIPYKTCTFDCIYCQLGRTTKKTTVRREYVPVREVLDELAAYLRSPHGDIDYVTLSGSGEPTLHSCLGRIIAFIKRMTTVPVAVLTNGSLFHDREVRRELMKADLVIPTLSADSETVFQCVHRPEPSISFARHVDGLIRFAEEFRHHLWLELFLLQGITGMEKNVSAMNRVIEKIKPEKIQINTATRPPCEEFAYPVTPRRLASLAELLPGNVEIVAEKSHDDRKARSEATEQDIIDLIRRRPCTVEDVSLGLAIHAAHASKLLALLVNQGAVMTRRRDGNTYFLTSSKKHPSPDTINR